MSAIRAVTVEGVRPAGTPEPIMRDGDFMPNSIGTVLGRMASFMRWGATLLFAVNPVAIVLTAGNVFVIEGYGRLRSASHGLHPGSPAE